MIRSQPNVVGNRHGLTLIELLVVVAIVAILVAILIPSLFAARDDARRAMCKGQLKELAAAWLMYLGDNNDLFPPRIVNGDINYGGSQGAIRAFRQPKPLNRYVGLPEEVSQGAEVFRCPADRGSSFAQPTNFAHFGTSYRMNNLLVGLPNLRCNGDPCQNLCQQLKPRLNNVTLNTISVSHGELLLMGDYSWYETWSSADDSAGVEWHKTPCTYSIAFLDGHVDSVRIRKGYWNGTGYTVVPFKDLSNMAIGCQACNQSLPCCN